MKSQDAQTFMAWLKVGRVIAAWSSYPAPISVPSQLKPNSEKEPISSFEAHDAVERAVIRVADDLTQHSGIKQLLRRAVKNQILEYTTDPLAFKRDAVIREVARRW